LGWLSEYDGPGAYRRKTWRGRDAEFIYNHVVNPQMLIWLAEAAGVPKAKVKLASAAALSAGATMQAMSGATRRVLPFSEIEELLLRCLPENVYGPEILTREVEQLMSRH
jgi:hypothetical protein